ncbi:prohibitin family protein [Kinneretia asaccharophila]|uniref:SPFH domain-containing protein n=1 Tax=Roseateles asaccharophilus TaxID=582607 RepID=A0A4R6NEK1_9BURK|nr:prohibitin family protein [Roseateles asaccharophilus]MDN3544970.1 prohibitin family protein [Roseateles asaccharophilus]TDP12644.1 SPFH domain-containing protein [Roseateles asaccharophilus]
MKTSALSWIAKVAAALFALYIVFSLLNPIRIVQSGTRGVITTFGKVDPEPLGEGIHFVVPLVNRVHMIDVRLQKNEGKGVAASRDLQQVSVSAALNWRLDPALVAQTFQNIGNEHAVALRVIEPAAQEATKAIAAQYTAEELVTKRTEVSGKIRDALEQRLRRHGVIVDSLAAVNYDFSAVFDKAIEAKVEAEQKKLTAERDLERIKVEAEQALAKARGEAESLKAKRLEITPDLLRLKQLENEAEAIKKWNGQLPQYTGAGTPFVQLNGAGSSSK